MGARRDGISLECLTRYHSSEQMRSERVICRIEHEKRNSISTSNHVSFHLSRNYDLLNPVVDWCCYS